MLTFRTSCFPIWNWQFQIARHLDEGDHYLLLTCSCTPLEGSELDVDWGWNLVMESLQSLQFRVPELFMIFFYDSVLSQSRIPSIQDYTTIIISHLLNSPTVIQLKKGHGIESNCEVKWTPAVIYFLRLANRNFTVFIDLILKSNSHSGNHLHPLNSNLIESFFTRGAFTYNTVS